MASSKCKPKLATPYSRADNVGVRDLEADAIQAEDLVQQGRYVIAQALPVLRLVRNLLTKKRNSVTFRDCKSWTEYCDKRLHCTPDAIWIAEKRLRLKQVPDEQAKEERRLARMCAEAERSRRANAAWLKDAGAKVVGLVGLASSSSLPLADDAHNVPDVPDDYEGESEDEDDAERVVPAHHVHDLLAALEQARVVLDRVVASGQVTELELLAATKRCAARAAKVAADVSTELGIGDGKAKVVNIADRNAE